MIGGHIAAFYGSGRGYRQGNAKNRMLWIARESLKDEEYQINLLTPAGARPGHQCLPQGMRIPL